jgi:hypothetical protein
MAKLIPSGVIQLPNFAELQYNLNERERQKQLEFDEWSSKFDKKAGTYLDGDREAVQTAYSGVEKALSDLARDPENIDLRRKVREANASYNEVAGTAQFLADNYRQQWSAYNSNPDQFDLGGKNAVELFDAERSTKRDANQIMSLASNPFTLMPKYKYEMRSPDQIAKEMIPTFDRLKKDFVKQDGTIDQGKAEAWAREYLMANQSDPNELNNAIVFEGVSQGKIGRNGQITSRADLDIINTDQFAPIAKGLGINFNDKTVRSFMSLIPERDVSSYDKAVNDQKIALEYAKLNQRASEAQRKNKYFGIEPAPYTQRVGDNVISSGYMIPIRTAKIPTVGGEISAFGKLNGKPTIIVEVKEKRIDASGKEFTSVREVAREAKPSDLSTLRKATEGLSDGYFNVMPSSQIPIRTQAQSAASGQLDIKGAEAALVGGQEQSSAGGVWSEEMFGESQFAAPKVATIPGITIVD